MTTGSSNSKSVAQYEKLRASYAANEIVNAERTGTALSKGDPSHRAASFLSEEQLAKGRVYEIKGYDGTKRTLLQVEGAFDEKKGIFEYILEPSGKVSHQRFIEGGIYTGFPNQTVPKGGY